MTTPAAAPASEPVRPRDASATPAGAGHATAASGPAVPTGRLVIIRHGQTEWSQSGQHTGLTDIPLTPRGEELARELAARLTEFTLVRVVSSPLLRAKRTAELVGFTDLDIDPNLSEWDYGGYEGLTTPQIRTQLGYDWDIWHDGVVSGKTPGESVEQVAARVRAVIDAVTPDLERGDVALVAHGHLLRILATVWLRQEVRFGAQLALDAGSLSVLGYNRTDPAIHLWNWTPPDRPAAV